MGRILASHGAARRLDEAVEWLRARDPAEPLLVLAPSAEAASRLVHRALDGRAASFGWQRLTPGALAGRLALPELARRGLAPASGLAIEAVCARLVHRLDAAGRLGRFAAVADRPGLSRALARTFVELGMAGLGPDRAGELEPVYAAYLDELREVGVADRARAMRLAIEQLASSSDPALGVPLLVVDLDLSERLAGDLVVSVAGRAPDHLCVAPRGDRRTLARLAALGPVTELPPDEATALSRVQTHLFEAAPPVAGLGEDVLVLSAPGESRECVEIARRVLREAERGVPFDRMAILLRAPGAYRAHLLEALGRAGVPAHFTRGAVRPDPAGRALLALLACRREGLSARAFGEYLSLGVLPDPDGGGPPAARPPSERWVSPDEELLAFLPTASAEPHAPSEPTDEELAASASPDRPVGSLRAPRRWEQLVLDAAVIGGLDRWRRRLDGLARGIELERQTLPPEDARHAGLERRGAELEALREFALPLLAEVAELPPAASWGVWVDRLAALATRALREPERVLAVLAELAPMAPIGPVTLAEVEIVLSRRLTELLVRPPGRAAGRVLVATTDEARGLELDVVFVPGLAEKIFPQKVAEDPVLLDARRRALADALQTNDDRVEVERLALRLCVGAAGRRLVLSYPRVDLERGRPRVPSFYGLEVLRAAEGRLPGFEELIRRADRGAAGRMGWPSPANAEDAIDEAEYDLAVLSQLLDAPPERARGAARYLVTGIDNPHLPRALRFRACRWLTSSWTRADGMVNPRPAARAALSGERLAERPYSPTALEKYASCPYRFYLSAVLRLSPREVPEPIEELDPLQRGRLVHDAQFALLGRLREGGLLPVTPERLDEAREILEEVLADTAARYRDELAPAIERVWEDGVGRVRGDLREWLLRAADHPDWVPTHFELAFGLRHLEGRDAASVPEPVELSCGVRLRGSIDLVEQREGVLRATDHKTGKVRVKSGAIIDGGRSLQPVLYALALERIFEGRAVDSGRLHYCTLRGGYAVRSVRLDDEARAAAGLVAATVDAALDEGFLPAAPESKGCTWCDYRVVCGAYEERRVARKKPEPLVPLGLLRGHA